MAIETHPVWPFEPNWTSSVGETLEWLTDVLASPKGAEQRRTMRYFPRRTIDFTIATEGPERALLDNLLMSYGARNWYLPLWHDVTISTAASVSNTIACVPSPNIKVGTVVFIAGETPFDYQVAEVSAVGASTLTFTAPLDATVPSGSRIHPMTVARLVEQPRSTVMSDSLSTAEPQFVITEKPDDPGVVIRDAGPMILNGLIVNAYHQETGRGGYFHHNSGTSEGQFIFIYSLYLAYEQLIGGTPEQQAAGRYYKTLAETMLDAMGTGDSYLGPMLRQPIPSNVNTITLLHWLFAARGDIPGQEVVLANEITRTGSTLVIPANAGGGSVFKVWQIYPGTSTLLYDSPFSPAFDTATPTVETQVLIDESDWTQVGSTVVITIPAGSPSHPTWKVVYGYNTTSIIPQGHAFEAYPNWTSIDPGYSACAPDTFRWFEQAMQKAIQHDARPGMADRWEALQLAMRRTAVKGQNITDLREVFEPMPGFDAIPLKGAPDGMYCYTNRADVQGPVGGGNPDWKGYLWWSRDENGVIVGNIPEDSRAEDRPRIRSVKATGQWTSAIVSWGLGTLIPATTLTIGSDTYAFASRAELELRVAEINASHPTVTATLTVIDIPSGEENVGHRYVVAIKARTTGSGGNSIALAATTGTVSGATLTGGVDASGGPTIVYNAWQVQLGRGFSDEWRAAETYQASDKFLYVRIGASKKPGTNEHLRVYLSATQAYDPASRWFADIGSLPEFVASGGTAEFFIPRSAFRLVTNFEPGILTDWGTVLPVGTKLENFGIETVMGEAYTIRLHSMRLVSADTSEAVEGSKMPFFPGSMPFAINADVRRQRFVGWNGSPFHGYQLADFWWWLSADANAVHPDLTVADLPIPASNGSLTFPIAAVTANGGTKPKNALLMEQQLMFLKKAQDKYAADGGPSGFFAHTFVLNTPARASLGDPTPHTWVYVNDDPNTRWVGYQTRIVESLAELLLLTKDAAPFSDAAALALTMVEAWLSRLNTIWPDLDGQMVGGVRIYGMPTDYPDPAISDPVTLYEEPHAASHVLRACLTLKKAGVGNTSRQNALITRCWEYLEMMWRTSGEMRYTWSPNPASKQWYGFWHGDIITALALMLDNTDLLPAGVDAGVVATRLVQTREWIEEWGVGRLQDNVAAGLLDQYRGFYVLTLESDWTDRLERGQERLLDVLESQTGTDEWVDTALRPFPTQKHQWVLDGFDDHARFYALAQVLRGRAVPVWVPTWMEDMRLNQPIAVEDATVTVNRCGFTMAGGPRPEREDIMIETVAGARFYRRIVSSAMDGSGREALLLDNPIGVALSVQDVLRICFVSLMRLDHDSIEINHLTDIEGVSEVQVTFRAAPNLRVPDAAFYED